MSRIQRFYRPPALTYANSLEAFDESMTEAVRLAKLLEEANPESDKVLQLVSSVESFDWSLPVTHSQWHRPDLGLEKYQDWIEKILKTLREWFKKIRDWIKQHANAVSTALKSMKFQTENLKVNSHVALKGLNNRTQPMVVTQRVYALAVMYRPPLNVGSIISGLAQQEQQLESYYRWQSRLLQDSPRFARTLQNVNLQEWNEDQQSRVLNEVKALLPNPAQLKLSPIPGREGDYGGIHLQGSRRLVYKQRDPGLGSLQSFNGVSMALEQSMGNPQQIPNQFNLPHFTLIASDQCLDQILSLVKTLQPHFDAAAMRKRMAVFEALEKAGEQLAQAAQNLEDGHPQAKNAGRQLLYLSRTVADWLETPYQGLANNALNAMRGAYMVCSLNSKS